MNDENYWKQFVKSGRVQDYLAYAKESGQKKEAPEKEDVFLAGKEHAHEGKNMGKYPMTSRRRNRRYVRWAE